MSGTLQASLGLAARSLLLVRRIPSVFIPAMVMPLFILVATAGAFHGIGEIPQLAGTSYLRFTVPMAVTMGGGFAGINAGMTLARDVEGGFFDRLHATPVPRGALLLGPLIATAARSAFTTTIVLIAAAIGGVLPQSVVGTLVLYVLGIGFALIAACWAMGIALRARTIQSAPMMQIAVFLSVFLSVPYTPREAQIGWLRRVSDVNPVTRILEAGRDAISGGVAWPTLWPGLLALAGLLTALGVFAFLGLRRLTTE